jgi:cytochrome c oxidase subunit 2
MQSLPKAEALPVGKIIEDGVLFLEPGEKRNITVAFRNPTSSEVSFMTQPYDVSPANGLPKTRLTCFCMSMVYKAPAEGSWYRVLGVGVADDASPGSKLDAMFTILTNPEWFAMKAHGAEATKTSMQQAQKTPASPLIESGKLVAARNGCQSCHSPDGMSSPGPTWEHLFGAMRKFVGGAPVRCDREYLRESILNPNAKIVEGYPPGMMPDNYSQKLSDEQLHALIEYIISLAN